MEVQHNAFSEEMQQTYCNIMQNAKDILGGLGATTS
jgi:hypothetical protein